MAQSIDNVVNGFGTKSHGSVKESFKHHDEVTSEDSMNDIYNNLSTPAHDAMYNAFKTEVEKIGDRTKSVYGKKKALRKAASEAIKAFFEKANPAVLEGLEGIEDEDAIYEHLIVEYNRHTGADDRSGRNDEVRGYVNLGHIIEGLSRNKKQTVGHAIKAMDEVRSKNKEGVGTYISAQAHTHFIERYRPHTVGKHIKGELDKRGVEVDDQAAYSGLQHGTLLELHKAAKKGDFEKIGDISNYGLKYKKDKDE